MEYVEFVFGKGGMVYGIVVMLSGMGEMKEADVRYRGLKWG